MDCEAYRERICVDPAHADPALLEHERTCVACRAYGARVRQAESLIHSAIRFDTAQVVRSTAIAPPRRMYNAWSGIAAAIIAGIAIWFGLGVNTPTATEILVAEVTAHWNNEPNSWAVTNASISERQLNQVLAGQATLDLTNIGPVTYANKCQVAGQWMSHLVVQSDVGPVMVLLIPQQKINSAVPLAIPERGLGGTIIPVGSGSIAILGEGVAGLESVERQVAAAIDWSI